MQRCNRPSGQGVWCGWDGVLGALNSLALVPMLPRCPCSPGQDVRPDAQLSGEVACSKGVAGCGGHLHKVPERAWRLGRMRVGCVGVWDCFRSVGPAAADGFVLPGMLLAHVVQHIAGQMAGRQARRKVDWQAGRLAPPLPHPLRNPPLHPTCCPLHATTNSASQLDVNHRRSNAGLWLGLAKARVGQGRHLQVGCCAPPERSRRALPVTATHPANCMRRAARSKPLLQHPPLSAPTGPCTEQHCPMERLPTPLFGASAKTGKRVNMCLFLGITGGPELLIVGRQGAWGRAQPCCLAQLSPPWGALLPAPQAANAFEAGPTLTTLGCAAARTTGSHAAANTTGSQCI